MPTTFITNDNRTTTRFTPQELDEHRLKRDSDAQERSGSYRQRVSSIIQEPTLSLSKTMHRGRINKC